MGKEAVVDTHARGARRLGLAATIAFALLCAAYAGALAIGLARLPSPDQPIGDPVFTLLEVLILAMAPALVAMFVAIHALAAPAAKATSLAAVVFIGVVAGITSCVHFAVLTLSRQPAFADASWAPLLLSFRWPSVPYALDILAWDVFFPLAVLFAAPAFGGSRLGRQVRALFILAGVLSAAGLAGVALNDMQVRNIGVVGYVGVFGAATVLLALLFHRAPPSP